MTTLTDTYPVGQRGTVANRKAMVVGHTEINSEGGYPYALLIVRFDLEQGGYLTAPGGYRDVPYDVRSLTLAIFGTPGAVLFDSDIRHQHYVVVKVSRAARKRDLGYDHKYGRQQIVEFAMSEAQWASFVSSMNSGSGVPATLLWDASADNPEVPRVPYDPRLQVSMDETHSAAQRAQADVIAAFEEYSKHKTVGNLRTLQARIENMTPNIDYAATKLSEHAENVVQRARADIEAFVTSKAQQLGLERGELGEMPQLGPGEDA